MFVDLLRNEDGAIRAQGQSDSVGGSRVEGDDLAVLVHPDGGVECVFAEVADDYAGDAGVEAVDDVAEQVVGHGADRRGLLDFEGDGVGFEEAYPDGEDYFAGEVVEDDDRHLGGGVHHEAANTNFYFWFGGREFVGFRFEAGEVHGL